MTTTKTATKSTGLPTLPTGKYYGRQVPGFDCPACSDLRSRPVMYGLKCADGETRECETGLRACNACGALYGHCYLGDSYEYVKPFMTDQRPEQSYYYDIDCLESEGVVRRHGWYDPKTGYITQVG